MVGHTSYIQHMAVLDDTHIISASYDYSVRVWNILTGECTGIYNDQNSITYCIGVIDQNTVVLGQNRNLVLFDIRTMAPYRVSPQPEIYSRYVAIIDRSHVVVGCHTGQLFLIDLVTDQILQTFTGHQHDITGIVILENGLMVTCSYDYLLIVWNIQTGHTRIVRDLAILNNDHVVSTSEDTTVRIWNVRTGNCVQVLQGHNRNVCAVTVLYDGSIISWSTDRTGLMWIE
jgi:WD40 repeat protein